MNFNIEKEEQKSCMVCFTQQRWYDYSNDYILYITILGMLQKCCNKDMDYFYIIVFALFYSNQKMPKTKTANIAKTNYLFKETHFSNVVFERYFLSTLSGNEIHVF